MLFLSPRAASSFGWLQIYECVMISQWACLIQMARNQPINMVLTVINRGSVSPLCPTHPGLSRPTGVDPVNTSSSHATPCPRCFQGILQGGRLASLQAPGSSHTHKGPIIWRGSRPCWPHSTSNIFSMMFFWKKCFHFLKWFAVKKFLKRLCFNYNLNTPYLCTVLYNCQIYK